LAAGASALTSTAQAPTRPAKAQRHHGWGGHHGLCHRGEGNRGSSAAAPNL
jgi:hypothetical protein